MDNVIDFIKERKHRMITLSYKQLNSESFNQALGQLAHQTGFSNFQASYNVAKLTRQFHEELKIAREEYSKWTDAFVVKGEDGKPLMSEKPHPLCPWKIAEGKEEEFEKKMNEFLSHQITLKARPLHIHDLGNIQLSPQQVLALEPIFDPSAFGQPEASTH